MRRRVVLIVMLVSAVVIAGASAGAYAYFTSGSGGSGSADTGTTQPVVLTPGTAMAGLYPGGKTSVVLTVSNSNPSVVRVGSLALDTTQGTGGFAVDGAHSGCAVTVLSFSSQDNGGAGWDIPAKSAGINGTLIVSLSNALSMSAAAANACQGATFTVYLMAGS